MPVLAAHVAWRVQFTRVKLRGIRRRSPMSRRTSLSLLWRKLRDMYLLYFPDVWEMFPKGLSVMDSVAHAGYLTLGLDYFQGVGKIKSDKF